eukprot:756506-Hanusia_phi.AAC.9
MPVQCDLFNIKVWIPRMKQGSERFDLPTPGGCSCSVQMKKKGLHLLRGHGRDHKTVVLVLASFSSSTLSEKQRVDE